MVGQEIPEEFAIIDNMVLDEIWSKGVEKFAIMNFGDNIGFYKLIIMRNEGDPNNRFRSIKQNENIDTFRDRMVQEGWIKIWEKYQEIIE